MTSLSLRVTQTASVPVAEYERVGAEYYDPEQHPTCANFRSASERIVARWLGATSGQVVEVGCGRSVVAELLRGRRSNLRALTLLDSSWTMLRHSLPFVESGAMLVLSEADELTLRDDVADLLVASLGDPYNSEAFWRASRRVVRPDGQIIFSTPSFEWSAAFRRSMHHPLDVAEFVTREGSHLFLPSFILPEDEQVQSLQAMGLAVEAIDHVTLGELGAVQISPKLRGLRDEWPIVTGYLCRV